MTAGEPGATAQVQLAALSGVMRRHGLPIAERLDVVLRGTDAEAREFLMSRELWGRTGSIVYHAGLAGSSEARLDCEHAFSALGEWQLAHGYVTRGRDPLGRVLQATARAFAAPRRAARGRGIRRDGALSTRRPSRPDAGALECPGGVAGRVCRRGADGCRVGYRLPGGRLVADARLGPLGRPVPDSGRAVVPGPGAVVRRARSRCSAEGARVRGLPLLGPGDGRGAALRLLCVERLVRHAPQLLRA